MPLINHPTGYLAIPTGTATIRPRCCAAMAAIFWNAPGNRDGPQKIQPRYPPPNCTTWLKAMAANA